MVETDQSKGGWKIMQNTNATEQLCSQKTPIHFETPQDAKDMSSVEKVMKDYDVFVYGSDLGTSMSDSITRFVLVSCKSDEIINPTSTTAQRSLPRTTVTFSVEEFKNTQTNKDSKKNEIRFGSQIPKILTRVSRNPLSSSIFNVLHLGRFITGSKPPPIDKKTVHLKRMTPIIVKDEKSTPIVESVVCKRIPKILIIAPSRSFTKSLCCSLNDGLNNLTDDIKNEMKFGVFPEGRLNLVELPRNDIRRLAGLIDCSCCLLNPLAPGPFTLTVFFNFTSLLECEWLTCPGTIRKIVYNKFEDLIRTSNKVIVTEQSFGCEKLNVLDSMMRGLSRPVYVSKGLYE